MINVLKLKDFQAHARLTIEFDPHVTSIVGPSDVGKSAVIRALRWLTFNRPSGQEFIREGTERSEVTVSCEKHEVMRGKGKGGNHYVIDGQALGALGTDVPSRVQELLCLTEENFQQQHDRPFWFSETAGEVSRQLNSIVDLGVMDAVQSILATKLRQQRTECEVTRARLAEVQQKKDSLSYVPDLVSAVEVCEGLEAESAAIHTKVLSLGELVQGVTEHQKRAERLARSYSQGQPALAMAEEYSRLADRRDRLESLLITARRERQRAKRVLPDLGPLEKASEDLKATRGVLSRLISLFYEIRDEQKTLNAKQETLVKDSDRLRQMIGKECPLCGQRIPS